MMTKFIPRLLLTVHKSHDNEYNYNEKKDR